MQIGLDANIATAPRSLVRGPNDSNFVRDNQDDLLKHYKDKHEEDTRFFLQFVKHKHSSPPPLNKKHP